MMPTWQVYSRLAASAGLIIWGCEYMPGLASRPELAASWIGVFLVIIGTVAGVWTAYVARRGAQVLGVVLLAGAGAWAWNARFYFDPERVPGGAGPPLGSYLSLAVLLLLGVLFTVFFRYLYPRGSSAAGELPKPKPKSGVAEGSTSGLAPSRSMPWHRLALLVAAAAVAIAAGRVSGLEDPGRTQLTILVLVLGCLAAGLISEETLIKLVPGTKK